MQVEAGEEEANSGTQQGHNGLRYKVKTMATHTCDAKRWINGPVVVFAEPTREEPRTEMESCWERAEVLDMDWMI
ncbi:UNVERIFIED_CONTAM: hypothetical protein FKN15_039904 [Acipenser sinensis]